MKKTSLLSAFAVAIVISASCQAQLDIFIDMDPFTAGIQSTLSIESGNNFEVDVVIRSDGATTFSAVGLAVEFNTTTNTINLAANNRYDPDGNDFGDSGVAGAAMNPFNGDGLGANSDIDDYNFPAGGGAYLNSDGGTAARRLPPAAFPGNVFWPGGMPANGTDLIYERLTFTAATPGTTQIEPFGILFGEPFGGNPPGPGNFHFDRSTGFPGDGSFPANSVTLGSVTVTAAVPEPGTVGLMLFGLGLLFRATRARRSHESARA